MDITKARTRLIGRRIVEVRYATANEAKDLYGYGQHQATLVIALSDGALLIPLRDAEGNGPGRIFYQAPGTARGNDTVL